MAYPGPQHDASPPPPRNRLAENILSDWVSLGQVADSRDHFSDKAKQTEVFSCLCCFIVSFYSWCVFSFSDKKRKLETKQEPKQNKKLKKNRDLKNKKDMKLKRKK